MCYKGGEGRVNKCIVVKHYSIMNINKLGILFSVLQKYIFSILKNYCVIVIELVSFVKLCYVFWGGGEGVNLARI